MKQSLVVEVQSLEETMALGRRLGRLLPPGAVVGLTGPLGAGKTHFVRAVSEGLGLTQERAVSSPTFVLIQEYEGRLPIYHFDAYRLRNEREFLELGAQEYFEGQGVCLVEWADKVANALPAEILRVMLNVTGEESRRFTFQGRGARYDALVAALRHDWKTARPAAPDSELAHAVEDMLQEKGVNDASLLKVLDKILSHFRCTAGTLHAWNGALGHLDLRAARNIPGQVLDKVKAIPIGKGMAGIAAERRRPVQVCNLQTDTSGVAKPSAKETRMEGSIAVPLLHELELAGVLGIAKPTAYQFSAAEIDVLQEAGAVLARYLV
jgi:tRNA threonylcarbamoyladenosine biosynthesis protein TsaE